MKLWVDGQCFQSSSRNRGIGRYAFELLQAIAYEHPDVELHLSLNAEMVEEAIAARDGLLSIIDKSHIHMWHSLATGGEAVQGYTAERRLSEIALAHHVNCLSPDVALSLSPFEGIQDPSVPLLPTPALNMPVLGIFYDAIPARYRGEYLTFEVLARAFDRRMNACREFADVLCISDFALREARELLGTTSGINISAGVSRELDHLLKNSKRKSAPSRLKQIVYVGALDWRKNVSVIPKALSLLPPDLRQDVQFIMAGDHPNEPLNQIKKLWRALQLDPNALKCIGHISDEELIELYQAADIVIQPSFMEGFGLTALEAILCETPVIAARAGALPEVVGLDDLLFDPHSPHDLADKIRGVLTDQDIRSRISERRAVASKQFNWSHSAQLSVDLLKQYAHKTNASLPALRNRILSAIAGFSGPTKPMAEMLALAEPPLPQTPRLIVDATATIRTQYRTGIQRVVRHICHQFSEVAQYQGNEIRISYADDATGWHHANGDLLTIPDKSGQRRIIPQANDCILMLDSSWDIAGIHRPFLQEARARGAEVISCLYDTVPLKVPAFTVSPMPQIFRDWLTSALGVSTGFVCISKAVADELHSLLRDIRYPHPMKIGYWRLGADFMTTEGPRQARSVVENLTPSFLMVGTVEPRKGHVVALDAFDLAWEAGLDVQLTIVGKYGWSAGTVAERIRTHPELGRRLHWHSGMEDDELIRLYMQCDALIAASYAEGFGLPIVEAGRFGVPIIASDLPVFREVAAGAPDASFFETGSAPALFNALTNFVQQRNRKGRTSAGAPPDWPGWAESSQELLDVILGGNWYVRYEPHTIKRFHPPSRVGHVAEDQIVEFEGRACELRLVGPLVPGDEGETLHLIVAVTNKSSRTWLGRGDDEGRFGVALSYHILGKDGQMLSYDNPRTPIVLALQPGDTHYLPITVPAKWLDDGAEAVEIEIVQESVAWWGNSLRVPLQARAQSAPVKVPTSSR